MFMPFMSSFIVSNEQFEDACGTRLFFRHLSEVVKMNVNINFFVYNGIFPDSKSIITFSQ